MKPNKKSSSRKPLHPLALGKASPKTSRTSEEKAEDEDSEKGGSKKRPPIFTDCRGAAYQPGMVGWVRGSTPMGSIKL